MFNTVFDSTDRDMAPHPAQLHRLHSALQSSQSAEHRNSRAASRSYEFPPPIGSTQPLWQGLSNERSFQHQFPAQMYAQNLFPPTLQTFSRRDEILAELHRVTLALETLAQGARECRIAIPPQLLCRLAAAFRQLEVTPTAPFVQQPYQPNFTQQSPQTPSFVQRNTHTSLTAIRGNYQQRYRPYHRFNRPESRASDVRHSEGQLRPRVDFALMQRTEVEDEYGRKRRLLKQSNTPSNRFERADAESDSNNDTRENSPTPARNDNKQDTDEQAKATLEKHEPEKSIIVRNLAPGTTADDVEAAFKSFGTIVLVSFLNSEDLCSMLVQYAEIESVQRAIDAMYNILADGRYITVEAVKSKVELEMPTLLERIEVKTGIEFEEDIGVNG